MKGDFSRIRFDAANRFSRVLLQQGRVTLDADTNEQTEILLHYLRALAHDLIGDFGGPIENGGFELRVDGDKLHIGAGRYYVHGILVESDGTHDYANQPDFTPPLPDASGKGGDALLAFLKKASDEQFWIYLDVWERHVTALEDPRLREPALGGADTCTRTQVVWQVRAIALDAMIEALLARKQALDARIKEIEDAGGDASEERAALARVDTALAQLRADPREACSAPLVGFESAEGGMAARLERRNAPKTPCVIAPGARYRGTENQLYRVEIHRGGGADHATFKWSRDNGSVASAWLAKNGDALEVGDTRGFAAEDWVELSDDEYERRGDPGVLVRLADVDSGENRLLVDAESSAALGTISPDPRRHSSARGWNQRGAGLGNGIPLLAAGNPQAWISLEDGVQVRFDPEGDYRTGDYWLIPARVDAAGGGDIEWPDGDAVLPPRRVEHYRAPLAWIRWNAPAGTSARLELSSCLCTLRPLTPCQGPRATVVPVGGGPRGGGRRRRPPG